MLQRSLKAQEHHELVPVQAHLLSQVTVICHYSRCISISCLQQAALCLCVDSMYLGHVAPTQRLPVQ
jgi:hypothetical protein